MLKVGTRVSCAYRGNHRGTLLSIDDPRAWDGSIAFGLPEGFLADPDVVAAHVERHRALLESDDRRPVLWDFGRVYWDSQLSPDPWRTSPDGWVVCVPHLVAADGTVTLCEVAS